jgi:hypothetical protein
MVGALGLASVLAIVPDGISRRQEKEDLVPTARLELAQLSPLPPQDSVSTNFTTSAEQNSRQKVLGWREELRSKQL